MDNQSDQSIIKKDKNVASFVDNFNTLYSAHSVFYTMPALRGTKPTSSPGPWGRGWWPWGRGWYETTVLYSTLLYSTLLYSTLLYSTLLYSTLLYSTVDRELYCYSNEFHSYLIPFDVKPCIAWERLTLFINPAFPCGDIKFLPLAFRFLPK
jgi:hypothetical protein